MENRKNARDGPARRLGEAIRAPNLRRCGWPEVLVSRTSLPPFSGGESKSPREVAGRATANSGGSVRGFAIEARGVPREVWARRERVARPLKGKCRQSFRDAPGRWATNQWGRSPQSTPASSAGARIFLIVHSM